MLSEEPKLIKHLAQQFITYRNNKKIEAAFVRAKKIALAKIQENPDLFHKLPQKLADDPEIIKAALDKDPLLLLALSEKFKSDGKFIQAICDRKFLLYIENKVPHYKIPTEFINDSVLVVTLVKLKLLPPKALLQDKILCTTNLTYAVRALGKDWVNPEDLSPELINDPDFLSVILEKNLYVKKIFSRVDWGSLLLSNKVFCLEIVTKKPHMLELSGLSAKFNSDLTIIKQALKQTKEVIKFVDKNLKKNIKELVIIAIKEHDDTIVFSNLSADLQKDPEVCLVFLHYCNVNSVWDAVSEIPEHIWQESISANIEQIEKNAENFFQESEFVNLSKSENTDSKIFCDVAPNEYSYFQLKKALSLDEQKIVKALLSLQPDEYNCGNDCTYFQCLEEIANDSEIKDKLTFEEGKSLICKLLQYKVLSFDNFNLDEPLRKNPQILLQHFDVDAKNIKIQDVWQFLCKIPNSLENDEIFSATLKNQNPDIHKAFSLRSVLQLNKDECSIFLSYLESELMSDSAKKKNSTFLYKLVVGRLCWEGKIEISEISCLLAVLSTLEKQTVNPYKKFQPKNDADIWDAVFQIPLCILQNQILLKGWDPIVEHFAWLRHKLNLSNEEIMIFKKSLLGIEPQKTNQVSPDEKFTKLMIVKAYLTNKNTIGNREEWLEKQLEALQKPSEKEEKSKCTIF